MLGSAKRNITKILVCALLVAGLGMGAQLTLSSMAHAAPGDPDPGVEIKEDDKGSEDEGTTCAIEKTGWILCPFIETSAKVGDQAFQYLAKNFLETEPELVASVTANRDPTGTYVAWELARNIANILFIVAFVIIILSQVTGRGLDNYGIKKLLPKLIIAAIAVNISYYICQLMVDLTNVIGYEVQNFMVDAARQITTSVAMPPQTGFMDNQTSNGLAGGTLSAIAVGVLSLGLIVWLVLPMLFIGISTVVITCIVIIAILLMRKAFIVLLVVLSPIAFVAYLLPNTEKYFQKWLNMFWQLLLVFPVIGLLFGAGQLASTIVLVAGTSGATDTRAANESSQRTTQSVYDDGSDKCIELPKVNKDDGKLVSNAEVKTCVARSTPFMLGLVAAGIAVAPLIAVWAVLKGALSAAGAVGGKIAGAVQTAGAGANKYARKPEDAFRKGMFTAYKARALRGDRVGIGGRTTRFIQRRRNAGEARDNELKAAEAGFSLWDKGAENIAERNISAQQQANAAHIAEMQEFARSGKAGDNNYLGAAGNKESISNALDTQKKRASEEIVKAYSEGLSTTDIGGAKGLEGQLRVALHDQNENLVKALVDELAKSTRGRTAIRTQMEKEGISAGSAMDTTVRQRIQTNAPGAKEKDAALKSWADGGGGTYASNWGSDTAPSGTWERKVDSLDKFTAMDGDAQTQAWKQFSAEHKARLKSAMAASPEALSRVDLALRNSSHW